MENDQINGLIPWNGVTAAVWYDRQMCCSCQDLRYFGSFDTLSPCLLPEKMYTCCKKNSHFFKILFSNISLCETLNVCHRHDEGCLTVNTKDKKLAQDLLFYPLQIWYVVNKPNWRMRSGFRSLLLVSVFRSWEISLILLSRNTRNTFY